MRIIDIIKTSQKNLFLSKPRTFLTIAAVFIGALALSLTNGVGNGIKTYVNTQLGNLGAENALVIQAQQGQAGNPVDTEVKKYDPNREIGGSFNMVMISKKDIEQIKSTPGIVSVTPEYAPQLEYIGTGADKYQVTAQQYVEGLNLEMVAGRTVGLDSTDEITIPTRYIKPGTETDVIGKYITIGYKDPTGKVLERSLKIVGVQQNSLLGNSAAIISQRLAEEINREQTAGVPKLADNYLGAVAQRDPNLTDDQVEELKEKLGEMGYNARTLEDQIGIIGTVIDSILVVLNIFGIITLLAAAFGIINTLLMSVNERTSEIGLMKALGANRKTIFSIFALEAASIGFWGALLGVLVSIALGTIANNVASETFLKDFVGFDLLAFPPLPTIAVLVSIILLSFIAGALPSLKASKLDPIKALRYE
jgi:putative ABC transport system permease protein